MPAPIDPMRQESAEPVLRSTPELTVLALLRMMLGFAFIMLSIRLLGSESYGRYSTVLSIAAMFMFAYIGVMGVLVSRLVEARRLPLQVQIEALRELFCAGFLVALPGAVFAVLSAGVAILCLPDSRQLHLTIAACALMLLAQLATALLGALLEGMGRVRLSALVPMLAQLGASVVMAVCYLRGQPMTLAEFLLLVASMFVLEALVAASITARRIGKYIRWRPNAALIKELAREGSKLQMARLVTLTIDPVTKGILTWFLGPSSVAVYDVVNKLAAGLQSVFSAYTRLFQQFSRSAEVARRDSIQLAARYSWVLFLLCASLAAEIIVIPAANWLKLNPVIVEWCFVLCVLSHWWQVVATPMFVSLITFGRYRFIFDAQVLLVVCSLIGSIVFVPFLGVAGVFIGYLLATIINVIRIEQEFSRNSDSYRPSLESIRQFGGKLAAALALLLSMPLALPLLDTTAKYWIFVAIASSASLFMVVREPIWPATAPRLRRIAVRAAMMVVPTKRR